MSLLARWLGMFIGEAIKPIMLEVLRDYFGPNTGKVVGPSDGPDTSDLWADGVPKAKDGVHSPEAGNDGLPDGGRGGKGSSP